MILNLERFLARERPYWDQLDRALEPFDQDRFHRPSLEESLVIFDLYQRAAADLVRLQEAAQPELSAYLEALVARAYTQIHSVRRRGRFHPLNWLTQTFPLTFRRQWRAFVLACCLMSLGAGFGVTLLRVDPDAKRVLMPFPHLMTDPAARVKQEEKDKGKELAGHQIEFSASLMANNIGVSFTSMAAGMTFGILTMLIIFSNGLDLGAVAFDYVHAGQSKFLLGWLLPHGVFEIPALLIASQAGFVLAGALIGWQSRLTRSERLRAISGDVFTLAAGSTALLVWAGLIESFVSQYHEPILPYAAKIAFGLVELVVLAIYLARSGHAGGSKGKE
ncbi:MAG TPA: stage II sporulation protein M [Bryobacteraceae bacterium]|nr:stage II sporulation protein M [Bryobacteraceae bacterium]